MMRTILFIHFNPGSGRLEQLVKRIPYATQLLRQMIREVWLERKSDFQNEMRQNAKILGLLNSAIRNAEDKNPLE